MIKKILKILKEHFPQYNDYKLEKIAREIHQEALLFPKLGHTCANCIYFPTLMTTFIGQYPPNLCQKGRVRGDAYNCPYYTENTLKDMHDDLVREWKNGTLYEWKR